MSKDLGGSLNYIPTRAPSGIELARLLSEKEINEALAKLDGWSYRRGFLVKRFDFDEFMEGIEFIERVARVAEALDHHPDFEVRYTTVVLKIQTHTDGGVTRKDVRLAGDIDSMGAPG